MIWTCHILVCTLLSACKGGHFLALWDDCMIMLGLAWVKHNANKMRTLVEASRLVYTRQQSSVRSFMIVLLHNVAINKLLSLERPKKLRIVLKAAVITFRSQLLGKIANPHSQNLVQASRIDFCPWRLEAAFAISSLQSRMTTCRMIASSLITMTSKIMPNRWEPE